MTRTNNTNNQPMVSIIMNCYNGEKYLYDAINSVYNQTFNNWEIVFWDNASTDKSATIAKSFNSKLKYYRGKETIGLGAARNKALDKCNGEFIAFLDCDDLWLPEKLENQVDKMISDNDIIVCYSDGYFLYGSNKSKNKFSSSKNVHFYKGEIFDHLILSNFINWQTVLINRKLGGGNLYFHKELTYSEDHEILLRLSLNGKIKFSTEPLIYYRVHKNNMSRNYKLILKETDLIFQIFAKEIEKRKINIKKAKALIYGSIIITLIEQRNNDYKLISKYLIMYSNLQNIIVYCLIKFNLTSILRFYSRTRN